MGQTVAKTIILSEFTEGSEARPTGSHFIAIVTKEARGSQLQWNLTPSSWGYGGKCSDEVIVGKILEEIARQNVFEGEDSRKQALDLLAAAGEKGIVLELPANQWKSIENVSEQEEERFYIQGERSVPRLER